MREKFQLLVKKFLKKRKLPLPISAGSQFVLICVKFHAIKKSAKNAVGKDCVF